MCVVCVYISVQMHISLPQSDSLCLPQTFTTDLLRQSLLLSLEVSSLANLGHHLARGSPFPQLLEIKCLEKATPARL